MFKPICARLRRCKKETLEPLIELAVEIAREGREGRRIGTVFTFGDADAVLARSRPLILDPLAGHSVEARSIADPNLRGTVRSWHSSTQGVAYVAEASRLYVANDKGGLCSIYDGRSLALLSHVDLHDDADNVRYDQATKRV